MVHKVRSLDTRKRDTFSTVDVSHVIASAYLSYLAASEEDL